MELKVAVNFEQVVKSKVVVSHEQAMELKNVAQSVQEPEMESMIAARCGVRLKKAEMLELNLMGVTLTEKTEARKVVAIAEAAEIRESVSEITDT